MNDDLPGGVEEYILTLVSRPRGSSPTANAYRDGIQSGAEWMARWLLAEVCLACGRPKLDHPTPDWYIRKLRTRAEFYARKRGSR